MFANHIVASYFGVYTKATSTFKIIVCFSKAQCYHAVPNETFIGFVSCFTPRSYVIIHYDYVGIIGSVSWYAYSCSVKQSVKGES